MMCSNALQQGRLLNLAGRGSNKRHLLVYPPRKEQKGASHEPRANSTCNHKKRQAEVG